MSDDLGTGRVAGIDPLTGYPRDEWGHLLDTISSHDGRVLDDWDKVGTELPNFTSPYGFLQYACGSGDDFHCFDFAVVNAGPRGEFCILHAVVNSETGAFIEDASYVVLPCNTVEQKRLVVSAAFGMVDQAQEWLCVGEPPTRHTKKGWNQEPWYFAVAVAETCRPWLFKTKTGKQLELRRGKRAYDIAAQFAFHKDGT